MIHLFTFTWATVTYRYTQHYPASIAYGPAFVMPMIEKAEAKAGLVLNWRAAWVGAHWGSYNRRLCVNLLPFVTLWITLPGGQEP
jgi:hypothetical protein